MSEIVVVKRGSIQQVRVTKIKKRRPIEVSITNYDPRLARIKQKEEPTLRERKFKPIDNSLTTWTGSYKGHRTQIVFPQDYPAVPLQWYWDKAPSGFINVVDNQLCIEALLNKEKWAPDITVETIFDELDSHPYFRRK